MKEEQGHAQEKNAFPFKTGSGLGAREMTKSTRKNSSSTRVGKTRSSDREKGRYFPGEGRCAHVKREKRESTTRISGDVDREVEIFARKSKSNSLERKRKARKNWEKRRNKSNTQEEQKRYWLIRSISPREESGKGKVKMAGEKSELF